MWNCRDVGPTHAALVGSIVVYPYERSVPGPERTEAMPSRRSVHIYRRRFEFAGVQLWAYLGGSPRPRPRPPEISTCCGLSRPRRRRKAAGHPGYSLYGRPSPCQLSRLSRPRAVVYSRGLLSARVALVPYDAAITGRAVRDRRLQSARVGLAGSLRQRRHGFAPALHRAAYCLRASPLPQATPRTRVARSATAGCDKLLSVDLEGRC